VTAFILDLLPAGTSVPTVLLGVIAGLVIVALSIVAALVITHLVAAIAARRTPTPSAPIVIRNAQEI
jgi:hypothetical protein